MRLGPVEIGLILVIILIVFGAGKLPQVGSALGKSIREFRKSSRGEEDDVKTADSKMAQDSTAEKPTNPKITQDSAAEKPAKS
jgi:sec-independent protein translocase protein TatA